MRIFVAFEDVRLPMDVQPGQTVGDVKTVLKDHFKLNSSHAEGKILRMIFAGAILRDDWVCSDIGITSTSVIKSVLIDSDQPVLHIRCWYNDETVVIRDQLDFSKTEVKQLQRLVSSKTGLPVTVFRLCTKDGKTMFGYHPLERYGIELGTTIHLHVWDGWGDLLKAATRGHTKKVLRNTSSIEQIAKYQFRVACYIAAHFGHVDLANSMINSKLGGIKPEEPVGQHPSRLWAKDSCHVDAWRTPIHEAVACGKVNTVRIFVQNSICSLTAKDGSGRTPTQLAFGCKQVECVQYLTSKLFSSYTENNVTLPVMIVIKTKKWSERARESVLTNQGAYKSSMKKRTYRPQAMVGHGIYVDGFNHYAMNSAPIYPELNPYGDASNHDHHYLTQADKRDVLLRSGRAFHVRYNSTASDQQLPKIPDRKSAEKHNRGTPNTRLNSATGSYLQTPVPQKDRLPTIAEGQFKTIQRTVARVEGRIPLPAISFENHLRPFFHATPKSNNPIQSTMKNFAKYRSMDPRDNAIQCMTMASTFKDMPWLRQVDLAISLASRGVKRSVIERPGWENQAKSLPKIAASPVKAK